MNEIKAIIRLFSTDDPVQWLAGIMLFGAPLLTAGVGLWLLWRFIRK